MIKYNFEIWVKDHIGYVSRGTGDVTARNEYVARLALTARFSLLGFTVENIKLFQIEDITFSLN